jgi:NAD(P)-dependent dehydrogenase (short-subunit alcohol dehydrogenase family)
MIHYISTTRISKEGNYMTRFYDKIVLITGAASGIGKASAERIASEGGTVVCVDRQEQSVREAADAIVQSGGKATAMVCDITDQAAVNATIANTVEQYGKLNALCNIAGVLRFDNTLEVTMEDFEQIMRINCFGTFMMCQAAIPHLLETKGFIVNMASTAALGAHAWTAAYSSSKGAVLALTKCLAVEYHLEGLNCNAICPAGVETPMVTAAAEQLPEGADMRLLTKVMSLDGSFAPASDVAGAVAFLACEDANFINGDYIRTDGGLLT